MTMIEYLDSAEGVGESHIAGFFIGWKKVPPPSVHLKVLRNSAHVIVARDIESLTVVGFITALTDGVMTAYIPLLEVLPSHQNQGIGSELMRRMLEKLGGMYMIDLLCEVEMQSFYEKFGMQKTQGMMIRNMHESN